MLHQCQECFRIEIDYLKEEKFPHKKTGNDILRINIFL